MPPMNLRWKLLGRPVKPVALGMMIAMVVIFVTNISDIGLLGDDARGDILGGFSLGVSMLFVYGFWHNSQQAAEWALLGSFFVWVNRMWLAALITYDTGIRWESVLLSLAWAIVAGGSYWLERTDPTVPRNGG